MGQRPAEVAGPVAVQAVVPAVAVAAAVVGLEEEEVHCWRVDRMAAGRGV